MELPEVRYARNGEVNIAFQVVGSGPVDLLYIPGWISHLDLYPWGSTPEQVEAFSAQTRERWGSEGFAREWLQRLAPSEADDPRQVAWHARLMRASATPAASERFSEMNALMDVRALLPLLHVPTLAQESTPASASSTATA